MLSTQESLTQNLIGTMWHLLTALRDPEYQRLEWVARENLHAMEDVLEDFCGNVEGLPGWTFSENLAWVYRSFGIPVGNALLPVYVAIEATLPTHPKEENELESFLDSSAWLNVIASASTAFDFLDSVAVKDEHGLPVFYNPPDCEENVNS